MEKISLIFQFMYLYLRRLKLVYQMKRIETELLKHGDGTYEGNHATVVVRNGRFQTVHKR